MYIFFSFLLRKKKKPDEIIRNTNKVLTHARLIELATETIYAARMMNKENEDGETCVIFHQFHTCENVNFVRCDKHKQHDKNKKNKIHFAGPMVGREFKH